MKRYILGVQRGLKSVWGYDVKLLEIGVFNCREEGLMAAIDITFSLQQSKGMVAESHNVLSKEHVTKLYDSSLLDQATPLAFPACMIFGIALITAMCPCSLLLLTIAQVQKNNLWRGASVEILRSYWQPRRCIRKDGGRVDGCQGQASRDVRLEQELCRWKAHVLRIPKTICVFAL